MARGGKARKGRAREKQPLPPALPPDRRPIGQLVAESIRFYGRHFWRSLLLGVPPAAVAVVGTWLGGRSGVAVVAAAGAIVITASYVAASALVSEQWPARRALATAMAVGILVYIPAPFLATVFVLPAIAWFAFVGLAVPAAVIERLGVRQSLGRGIELARADYVHALGSLATLAVIGLVTQGVMFVLLQASSDQASRVAAFIVSLVVSPIFFLGAALLYYDQAARVGSRRAARETSGDADLPDADRPGLPDARVESRPAAQREP